MHQLSEAGLASYPFRTIPPTTPTSLWVDRAEFRQELESMVARWQYRNDSAIYLLWAALGAGKTHALRYLEYLCGTIDPAALAIYSDLPRSATDFKGVYEQIAPRLPEDVLCDSIRKFRERYGDSWLDAPELQGDRDTPRVLWLLSVVRRDPQGDTARKWLRAERTSAREATVLDNVSPIKTGDDATRSLGTILRLIALHGGFSRTVLMVDEFQRIGQGSQRAINQVNTGIQRLYNSCPENLTLILTYSFGVPENIKYLVSGEVLSRVKRIFNLPALTANEAIDFVIEMLEKHRAPDAAVDAFEDSAIKYIVNRLYEESNHQVTPRKLMQVFEGVLDSSLDSSDEGPFPIGQIRANAAYQLPPADDLG
jgi:hypothetical protein